MARRPERAKHLRGIIVTELCRTVQVRAQFLVPFILNKLKLPQVRDRSFLTPLAHRNIVKLLN